LRAIYSSDSSSPGPFFQTTCPIFSVHDPKGLPKAPVFGNHMIRSNSMFMPWPFPLNFLVFCLLNLACPGDDPELCFPGLFSAFPHTKIRSLLAEDSVYVLLPRVAN